MKALKLMTALCLLTMSTYAQDVKTKIFTDKVVYTMNLTKNELTDDTSNKVLKFKTFEEMSKYLSQEVLKQVPDTPEAKKLVSEIEKRNIKRKNRKIKSK